LSGALAVSLLLASMALPMRASAAAKGRLQLQSLTTGAKVLVDGKPKGYLPLKAPLLLPAGAHKLKVSKAGYMSYEESIRIVPGKTLRREVMLLAYAGVLRLSSSPSGAEVWIDNGKVGSTPLREFELLVGEHTLRVSLPGYAPFEKELTVMAGETYQFQAQLERRQEEQEIPLASLEDLASPAGSGSAPTDGLGGDADNSVMLLGLVDDPQAGPAQDQALAVTAPALEGLAGADAAPSEGAAPEPSAQDPALASAPASALQASGLPAGKDEQAAKAPLWRRWWVWVAASALVVGVVGGGAAAIPRHPLDCSPLPGVQGHLGLQHCG